jgi:hypothetical protein
VLSRHPQFRMFRVWEAMGATVAQDRPEHYDPGNLFFVRRLDRRTGRLLCLSLHISINVMDACIVCGGSVATPARGRRPKFCSGRCRVKAHRDQKRVVEGVPAELRERDRWIRHEQKRPMAVGGWWASVTDPACWATYQDAANSPHGDGLGFVLNGDGVVCIDLDDCVIDGVPNTLARELIFSLPRTYVEFSPSGRGLHIWGFAALDAGRKFMRNGLKVEVYPNGRYLTVTGRAYRSAQFAELDLTGLLT